MDSAGTSATPDGGAPAMDDRPAKLVAPPLDTVSNVACAANVRVAAARLSKKVDEPLATVTSDPVPVGIAANAFRPKTPPGPTGTAMPAVPSNVKTPSGRKPGARATIIAHGQPVMACPPNGFQAAVPTVGWLLHAGRWSHYREPTCDTMP
jgi:hypothetical protein